MCASRPQARLDWKLGPPLRASILTQHCTSLHVIWEFLTSRAGEIAAPSGDGTTIAGVPARWGDPSILAEILRAGRSIRDPRVRRIYERAAVQTGLVESGGRNLPGGDQDSQGWRQERTSLYRNPRNVKASVRRFRDEFLQQYDPGERSYEVAAQVQRPREDLRGRYHDVAKDAASILRGQGTRGGGGGGLEALLTGGGSSGGREIAQGADVSALLAALSEKPQPVSSGGLAPPAFSAQAVMPTGAGVPQGGGGPAPKPDVNALLEAVRTVGGGISRGGAVDPATAALGGSTGGAGGTPAKGSAIKELIWAGPGARFIKNGREVDPYAAEGHKAHVHVAAGPKTADALGRLAQSMGLSVRENETFDPVDRVHAQGSYHYSDRAIDVSGDPRKMAAFARRVAAYQRRKRR
jgi:hypothetical protein